MDSKELKSTLKAAREAIRNKEFKDALRYCKSILKEDKGNYNALVFVGVAAEGLDQPEQVVAAYHKAIDVDSSQPLAWQGLCGFYEKDSTGKHREDLVNVYEKLVEITSDEAKKFTISLKLVKLYDALGRIDDAVTLLGSLVTLAADDAAKVSTTVTLINLLEKKKSGRSEDRILLIDSYRQILQLSVEGKQEYWTKMIKLMMQDGSEAAAVVTQCVSMATDFPDAIFPLETICLVHLDSCVCDAAAVSSADVSSAMEKLGALAADSALCKLVRGHASLLGGAYLDALSLLNEGLKVKPDVVSAWLYLARGKLAIHHATEARLAAEKGSLLLKRSATFVGGRQTVGRLLRLVVAMAIVDGSEVGSEDLLTAKAICDELEDVEETKKEALSCLGVANLTAGDLTEIPRLADELRRLGDPCRSSYLVGCCALKNSDLDLAETSLQAALEANPSHAPSQFELARCYWSQRQRDSQYADKCLTALLLAARLDPFHSGTFLYLGHCYSKVLQDQSKACRCYEKAYKLGADDNEAGIALVDCLSSLGEHERALKVLRLATSHASAGSCKWAWLRLGLLQLRQGDPGGATVSFQSALRADRQDSKLWECLGEAYSARGSHNAAMKAFTRATELDTESTYCYHKIASIKQALGMCLEAIDDYKGILETTPNYLPALKGLGETHLRVAASCLTRCLQGRALDHCQAAVAQLTRAVSLRPDLSCLWKLLGDVLTIIFRVQDEECRMDIPLKLTTKTDQTDGTTTHHKRELLAIGGRCYGMALKLRPTSAALWHDLGVNMYYQARVETNAMGSRLWVKAVHALQKAVGLDPSDHGHWTALGVVVARPEVGNEALAQHCFIKSLAAESNNVEAWTNLGALYLVNNKLTLAHEAFKMAQQVQPSCVQAWIGQALIAEQMSSDEAMDLFRHATELDNHAEGAVGYAQWVCKTLRGESQATSELLQYAITQMAAVPAASDALERHRGDLRMDAAACNIHGLLLERQGLNRLATEVFSRAVELLERSDPGRNLAMARSNYGRLLCKVGDHEAAIRLYLSIPQPDTTDSCGLGLAYYKAGLFAKSRQAFEAAQLTVKEEDQRAEILAVLGMVSYQDGQLEDAKAFLFQCFQCPCPSPIGLRALCSLGLLQGDVSLASAAVRELGQRGDLDDEVAFFTAVLCCLQGDETAAKRHLARCVHERPHSALLWRHLAAFLVKRPHAGVEAAARCGYVSSVLDPTMKQDIATIVGLGGVAAGWVGGGGGENALRIAQRALHVCPDKLDGWCVLLAAIHGEEVATPVGENAHRPVYKCCLPLATRLLATVEDQLSQPGELKKERMESLHVWCVKQYTVALLVAGRRTIAEQFLRQATWLYDNNVMLRALLAFLEQNIVTLREIRQPSPFIWQLLISLYSVHDLPNEEEACYREWAKTARSTSEQLTAVLLLAWLAYRHIIGGTGGDSRWGAVFRENVDLALTLDATSSAAHLMNGRVQLSHKNSERLARHSFQKLLRNRGRHSSLFAASLARRHLFAIHVERKDEDSLKSLMAQAISEGDIELQQLYAEHQCHADSIG